MLSYIARSYYNLWLTISKLKKRFPIYQINFKKPWWHSFTSNKWKWLLVASGVILVYAYSAASAPILSKIIETRNISYFFLFVLVWIVIEFWEFLTMLLHSIITVRTTQSIAYSAYRFFLTVDPVFHISHSSGQLFGKVERALKGYEDTLDVAFLELLPIVVRVLTVVVTFLIIDLYLGLIASAWVLLLAIINIGLVKFNSRAFEYPIIEADDSLKKVSLETLQQIQLIRSSFSTNSWNTTIQSNNNNLVGINGAYLLSFWSITFLSRLVYTLSVIMIGYIIISGIQAGSLGIMLGASFLIQYVSNTYKVIRIGKKLQKINQSITRIKDLYNFIYHFGRQTFPVLSTDKALKVKTRTDFENISIKADELYFAYPSKAQIFDGHSLFLDIPKSQENKLYGIIGPSGVGKTTLVSIIGGQLHPTLGTVEVDHVPVYEVDDMVRRSLIAIQGQVASSVSGNVKDNLLLGIPEKEKYSDKVLIDILYQVGLWRIFKEKEGLYSSVGEGGLNLSVGQRQRLNFASLYLRAKYFKPVLLIIDEPTSSLDEVSEHAITDMIDQLAKDALTLVIAHRLKTLQEAVAILDLSLISDKKLMFYSKQELEKRSIYYQQLLKGEVPIEE